MYAKTHLKLAKVMEQGRKKPSTLQVNNFLMTDKKTGAISDFSYVV